MSSTNTSVTPPGSTNTGPGAVPAVEAAPNITGVKQLMEAVYHKDLTTVLRLLDTGVKPNEKDEHNWSPLMLASHFGNLEIVVALLNKGADPNLLGASGWTALMHAARRGHIAVVKILLDGGADSKLKDYKGWTAQNLASYWNKNEIVIMLSSAKSRKTRSRRKRRSTRQ